MILSHVRKAKWVVGRIEQVGKSQERFGDVGLGWRRLRKGRPNCMSLGLGWVMLGEILEVVRRKLDRLWQAKYG